MRDFDTIDELIRNLNEESPDASVVVVREEDMDWWYVQGVLADIRDDGFLVVTTSGCWPDTRLEDVLRRWIPTWRLVDTQSCMVDGRSCSAAQVAPQGRLLTPIPGSKILGLRRDLIESICNKTPRDACWPAPPELSTVERALLTRGLIANYNGAWTPTLAGQLTCGSRPHVWVPGCRVVVDADGKTREFIGAAPVIILSIREMLGPKRGDRFGVGELIGNAFLHRDWSESRWSDPIQVRIRGDEFSVRSPGVIPVQRVSPDPGEPPDKVLFHRALVALLVASGRGVGLKIARGVLEQDGGSGPELFEDGGWVEAVCGLPPATRPPVQRAALPADQESRQAEIPTREPAIRTPTKPEGIPPEPHMFSPSTSRKRIGLSERRRVLVALLREVGEMSTQQIAQRLHWTRSTVRAVIAELKSSGVVTATESSDRSPDQRYRLVEGHGGTVDGDTRG